MNADHARAHALIDGLIGAPDVAADRAVAVLHARAAALDWVRQTLGVSATPASVAERLNQMTERLRTAPHKRDPVDTLGQSAVGALADRSAPGRCTAPGQTSYPRTPGYPQLPVLGIARADQRSVQTPPPHPIR